MAGRTGENLKVATSRSAVLPSTHQAETLWAAVGYRHVSGSSSLVVTETNPKSLP